MHILKTLGAAFFVLAASASGTFAQEQPVGIPVCDSFIETYERCVATQVPEAQRALYSGQVAQWRTSWRQLAANPQTRGTLEQVCQQQIEAMRQSLQAYGCRF